MPLLFFPAAGLLAAISLVPARCRIRLTRMAAATSATSGHLSAAADLLGRALASCPESFSPLCASVVVDGFCKADRVADARQLLDEMPRNGEKLNALCYNSLLDSYTRQKDMERIKRRRRRKGLSLMCTHASLVHGHCISGKLDVAQKLFEEMKQRRAEPNIIAYTALISGLAKEGRSEEAFELYDDMLRAGLTPDDSLYSALVGSLHMDNRKKCLPQTG